MTALDLLARLILAAVFLVSALTKLADRSGSRRAVTNFGVPASVAGPVADLLPLLELAVAVALLPAASAFWGAVAGVALLALFTAAIAVNLARGRKPACHCFGQLSSEPIGWSTLVRNLVLIAVGGFAVATGRTVAQLSAVSWVQSLHAAEIAGLIVSALALALAGAALWLLLQLLSQNGRLLNRLDQIDNRIINLPAMAGQPLPAGDATPQVGLAPGTPAPAFELKGLFGERMTLEALLSAGRPALLVFADPNCSPCNALMPDVGRWQRELAGTLGVTVVSRGSLDENRAKRNEHGLGQLLLQDGWEVSEKYQTMATPSALLVRPDGTIGSYVAQGAEEIRALVSRQLPQQVPMVPYAPSSPLVPAAPAPVQELGLPVGTPAPAMKLPDLNGKQVDLAKYRGKDTLLVFWNPGCGFCQQLLPQLKDWEEHRTETSPQLLLVSAGAVQDNRAHGFKSPIVLDDAFSAGSAFGASGTPSGVLVDAEGKIAAPLGVGGPAVMALANRGTA